MKRSTLKRKTGLKRGCNTLKRSRIPRISTKQIEENRQYYMLRQEFLKNHPWCAVMMFLLGKKIPATEIHHAKGRGSLINDTRFWIPVCPRAHRMIERHGVWARARGFQFEKGKSRNDEDHAAKCLEHQERVKI